MTIEEMVKEIKRLVKEEDALKERYKLHDLRKEPKDLPDKYGDYNVVYLCDGKHFYDMDVFIPDTGKFMAESANMPVIAWARYQKLKEDEEE